MALHGDGFVMDDGGNATVLAAPAIAFQRAPAGAELMLHNCPLCTRSYPWDAFQVHAPACIAAHPQEVAAIEARTAAHAGGE